jgi:hypothetical protein
MERLFIIWLKNSWREIMGQIRNAREGYRDAFVMRIFLAPFLDLTAKTGFFLCTAKSSSCVLLDIEDFY